MEGLAVVETGHIENTSKVYIQGDLSVLQRTLLPSRKKYYSLNEQILPHNSPELKNWRQENILKNYWSRNGKSVFKSSNILHNIVNMQ